MTIKEEVPTNSAGVGNVAGIGVGPQGEPPGRIAAILKKMLRRGWANAKRNTDKGRR